MKCSLLKKQCCYISTNKPMYAIDLRIKLTKIGCLRASKILTTKPKGNKPDAKKSKFFGYIYQRHEKNKVCDISFEMVSIM